MPSLNPLRTRVSAFALDPETSQTDRDYVTGLMAEVEATVKQLAPIQKTLAEKIAAKDELAAKLEDAKDDLRDLNGKRDPLSGKLNELLFKIGNAFGDTIGVGGGFRG